MDLVPASGLGDYPSLRAMGAEPLLPEFNAAVLAQKCRGKKVSIKVTLLDQRVVAGLGSVCRQRSAAPRLVVASAQGVEHRHDDGEAEGDGGAARNGDQGRAHERDPPFGVAVSGGPLPGLRTHRGAVPAAGVRRGHPADHAGRAVHVLLRHLPAMRLSASRSHQAGRARALRRHQPRRAVGADRTSFRRVFQPLLEAPVQSPVWCRTRSRFEEDNRLPEWGFGITNIVPRATPRDGHAPARTNTSTAAGGCSQRCDGIGRRSWPWSESRCFARCFPITRAPLRLGGPRLARLGTLSVFVLPNTSGRNANFSYAEMLKAFRALKRQARS